MHPWSLEHGKADHAAEQAWGVGAAFIRREKILGASTQEGYHLTFIIQMYHLKGKKCAFRKRINFESTEYGTVFKKKGNRKL